MRRLNYMACESDKCEKYEMYHDYKNGVEVRQCFLCQRNIKVCKSLPDCISSESTLYEEYKKNLLLESNG